MPFIPHTKEDIQIMLDTIGVSTLDQLFEEIPLKTVDLTKGLPAINEQQITRLFQERAPSIQPGHCFIGGGAYEHHIPAIVWQLTRRGEFYTSYTPYQAEASQGVLQLIYEYQSMMSELLALEISNASLYDGATALAEACLMAIRLRPETTKRILVPQTLSPRYQNVLKTILNQQKIHVEFLSFDQDKGIVTETELKKCLKKEAAALVIPQPNFFGCLEDVDLLTQWAISQNLLVIAVVNPTSLGLLKPPGAWGTEGVDIACGEGQPLGIPLSYGGPYFGFLSCKKEYIRQLSGRIVGRTTDTKGREGFTLTLQTREQHIRRAKATSNICTNQGLMVIAATIYLSLLGPSGLKETALACHQNTVTLMGQLKKLRGISQFFPTPFFHEAVIQVDQAYTVLKKMAEKNIQAGLLLEPYYPDLKNTLLICATETKTEKDLMHYVNNLKNVIATL